MSSGQSQTIILSDAEAIKLEIKYSKIQNRPNVQTKPKTKPKTKKDKCLRTLKEQYGVKKRQTSTQIGTNNCCSICDNYLQRFQTNSNNWVTICRKCRK